MIENNNLHTTMRSILAVFFGISLSCLFPRFGQANDAISIGEALDNIEFTWQTNGFARWFGQTNESHDGYDAVRNDEDAELSILSTTVVGPGVVSFRSKTVFPGYSSLGFQIGETQEEYLNSHGEWLHTAKEIPEGEVTIKWIKRAGSNSEWEEDICWIDQFVFTQKPVIQYVSADQTVFTTEHETIRSFSVSAFPLTYQWHKDGVPIDGATNSDYNVFVKLSDAGVYSVIVSNAYGNVQSSNSTLTVFPSLRDALDVDVDWGLNGLGWWGRTNVVRDNVDAAATSPLRPSEHAYISWVTYGPGILKFWWKVSCEEEFDYLSFSINGYEMSRISGEVDWHEMVFNIPEGELVLGWRYQKDRSLSNGEDTAWLDNVQILRGPIIQVSPVSKSINIGESITLTVSANGPPPLTYQWRKGGVDIPGATGTSHTLTSAQPSDSGTYSVVVSNEWGTVVAGKAVVGVHLPLTEALDGSNFVWTTGEFLEWFGQSDVSSDGFDAAQSGPVERPSFSQLKTWVQGPGILQFNWKLTGPPDGTLRLWVDGNLIQTITGESNWTVYTNHLDPGGHFVEWNHSGGDFAGRGTAWVDSVAVLPVAVGPPKIWSHPSAYHASQGRTVQFGVDAYGSPMPRYQWRFKGANLLEETNATLTLTDITPNDQGNYSVIVFNSEGASTSSNAFLLVLTTNLAEALDGSGLHWITGGDTEWGAQSVVTHDGIDAVKSGPLQNEQYTFLETTVFRAAAVRFWEKNAVQTWMSPFEFFVNGSRKSVPSFQTGWTKQVFFLTPERHTLRWEVRAHDDAGGALLDDVRVFDKYLIFQSADRQLAAWLLSDGKFVEASFMDVSQVANRSNFRLIAHRNSEGDGVREFYYQTTLGAVGWSTVRIRDGRLHVPEWQAFGVGDLDNDGMKDILFQHLEGWLGAWMMSGTVIQRVEHSASPSAKWRAFGVSDLNDDGQMDILFQHAVSRKLAVLFMHGTVSLDLKVLRNGHPLAAGWEVGGIADMDDNGTGDILLHHIDGRVAAWLMEGSEFLRATLLANGRRSAPGWKLVGPR